MFFLICLGLSTAAFAIDTLCLRVALDAPATPLEEAALHRAEVGKAIADLQRTSSVDSRRQAFQKLHNLVEGNEDVYSSYLRACDLDGALDSFRKTGAVDMTFSIPKNPTLTPEVQKVLDRWNRRANLVREYEKRMMGVKDEQRIEISLRIQEQGRELRILRQEKSKLQFEKNSLSRNQTARERNLDSARKRLNDVEGQIKTLETQIAEVKELMANQEKPTTLLEGRLSRLKSNLDRSISKRTELEAEIKSHETYLNTKPANTNDAKLAELETKIARLEELLFDDEAKLAAIKAKNMEAKDKKEFHERAAIDEMANYLERNGVLFTRSDKGAGTIFLSSEGDHPLNIFAAEVDALGSKAIFGFAAEAMGSTAFYHPILNRLHLASDSMANLKLGFAEYHEFIHLYLKNRADQQAPPFYGYLDVSKTDSRTNYPHFSLDETATYADTLRNAKQAYTRTKNPKVLESAHFYSAMMFERLSASQRAFTHAKNSLNDRTLKGSDLTLRARGPNAQTVDVVVHLSDDIRVTVTVDKAALKEALNIRVPLTEVPVHNPELGMNFERLFPLVRDEINRQLPYIEGARAQYQAVFEAGENRARNPNDPAATQAFVNTLGNPIRYVISEINKAK